MATELAPGTTFAGFRVESIVGRGAMAGVYRACDEHGRTVALKLLDASDERFRERFLRESELAASLDHSHIVRTLSAGEADGQLYLAMELVDGLDLRQLLRRDGRLEPERAVGIVEQAAAALDAAHKRGLVHRDVKPGNILVREDEDGDHAYVCDFGLARHVTSVSSLTGDRGFVGTIDYVSPEQIEGTPVDARADVYSLGCVLYECLTGVRPYDRDSELAVVFAHLNEPPPKATDARPELPAAFDDVFGNALAKSRNERYSSCGELATAARAALAGKVIARRGPRRRLVALAGAVAVGGGVTAAILLTQASPKPPATISATSIAGARLGESTVALEHLWGFGRKLSMQTPPNYSLLTSSRRHVSAYFVGSNDKAVELTTWNSNDRTPEGIGPCSSVADLQRAYGKRLRASPNAVHNGIVTAWLLGKHMIFATTPADHPAQVLAVGLYSDPVVAASFNVQNEGPCSAGPTSVNTTPAPKVAAPPALTKTVASKGFTPSVTLSTPGGWSLRTSSSSALVLASTNGTTLTITKDPVASPSVSGTPTALTTWLHTRKDLRVSAPETLFLSKPTLTWIRVDVSARQGSAAVFQSLTAAPGRPLRLYLANVRVRRTTHTLLVAASAPSSRVLKADLPAVQAVVGSFKVAAVSVPPLSALSSWCAEPFGGTCIGELTAGTHQTTSFRPKLTYTVPVGWTNETDQIGNVNLIPPRNDWQENSMNNGSSDFVGIYASIAVAKSWCGDGHGAIHTPTAFAAWLRRQPGMAVTRPQPVTFSGLHGYVVTIRVAKGWTKPCSWSHGQPAADTTVLAGLPPSPSGLLMGVLGPGIMRLWLLGYHGGTLGVAVNTIADRTLDKYSRVVQTFRFG